MYFWNMLPARGVTQKLPSWIKHVLDGLFSLFHSCGAGDLDPAQSPPSAAEPNPTAAAEAHQHKRHS